MDQTMLGLCERSITKGYWHFPYGGKPGVAEELRAELTRRFPGLQIVGTYTPPFRPLGADEEGNFHAAVNLSALFLILLKR
jgi:N-acetylglucosaminyldiphosphoundecaprenol N-acetyl-beta-D-mannosaminyltransferase